MGPLYWFCGSVRGGFRKGTVASAHLFVWENGVLTLMPEISVPSKYYWCLSNCYSSAGAQREGVWVSLCVGPLRGAAWESHSFFHWLNPHWEFVFLALEPWVGSLMWDWDSSFPRYLSWNFIHHMWVWNHPFLHLSIFFPTASSALCSFFNSLVVELAFNSISDGSEWWWFYILVVILMWFAKRQAVLTYATIYLYYWKLHFFREQYSTSKLTEAATPHQTLKKKEYGDIALKLWNRIGQLCKSVQWNHQPIKLIFASSSKMKEIGIPYY